MNGRFLRRAVIGFGIAFTLNFPPSSPASPAEEGIDVTTPVAGGEDLRIETTHGPLHLWRPADYDSHTAGIVIYIHGYLTSLDQTWADDRLATQFHESGRNALFIGIEAPQSNRDEVSWSSLADLLNTVQGRVPYSLPHGPLVVIGHSAAYRTILLWLRDPHVQYLILLDALYAGDAEFRFWLQPHPHTKPHRMVLVTYETWWQSNKFSHHLYGTARRKGIPVKAVTLTPRETRARLLYLRSQYDHNEIVNNGKVIPVLLQVSPLRGVAVPRPNPVRRTKPKAKTLDN